MSLPGCCCRANATTACFLQCCKHLSVLALTGFIFSLHLLPNNLSFSEMILELFSFQLFSPNSNWTVFRAHKIHFLQCQELFLFWIEFWFCFSIYLASKSPVFFCILNTTLSDYKWLIKRLVLIYHVPKATSKHPCLKLDLKSRASQSLCDIDFHFADREEK